MRLPRVPTAECECPRIRIHEYEYECPQPNAAAAGAHSRPGPPPRGSNRTLATRARTPAALSAAACCDKGTGTDTVGRRAAVAWRSHGGCDHQAKHQQVLLHRPPTTLRPTTLRRARKAATSPGRHQAQPGPMAPHLLLAAKPAAPRPIEGGPHAALRHRPGPARRPRPTGLRCTARGPPWLRRLRRRGAGCGCGCGHVGSGAAAAPHGGVVRAATCLGAAPRRPTR